MYYTGRKGRGKREVRNPYYSLREIRLRIKKTKVQVTGTAYMEAQRDFGWGEKEILDAVRKLKFRHFYKSEKCRIDPGQIVDYYKARGLKEENVYIHFYIDIETDELVVQSCKRLEE